MTQERFPLSSRMEDFIPLLPSGQLALIGGLSSSGELLRRTLPDVSHILLYGGSSGKTRTARGIIRQLCQKQTVEQLKVAILDLSAKPDLADICHALPHVQYLATHEEQAVQALTELQEIRRGRGKQDLRNPERKLEPKSECAWLIVVEEFFELEKQEEAWRMFLRFLRYGKGAKMYVLATTRRIQLSSPLLKEFTVQWPYPIMPPAGAVLEDKDEDEEEDKRYQDHQAMIQREELGKMVHGVRSACERELAEPDVARLLHWEKQSLWEQEVDRRIGARVAQNALCGSHYTLSLAGLEPYQILYNGQFAYPHRVHFRADGWCHLLVLSSRNPDAQKLLAIMTQVPGCLTSIVNVIENIASYIVATFHYAPMLVDVGMTAENTTFVEYLPKDCFGPPADHEKESFAIMGFTWTEEKRGDGITYQMAGRQPKWHHTSRDVIQQMIDQL